MLLALALVLAACVAPAAHEWVEISQHHYKKPVRTLAHPAGGGGGGGTFHQPGEGTSDALYTPNEDTMPSEDLHIPVQPFYEEEQIKLNFPNRAYLNHSLLKLNWNHDQADNAKRVAGNANIRNNVTPEFSLEIYGEVTESDPEIVTKISLKDQEVFSATIERVPNKGSVKRVKLSNTPVKSPSLANAVSPVRRNDIRHHGSTIMENEFTDEFEIKANIFRNAENHAVTPLNDVNNNLSSSTDTVRKYDGMGTSTSKPVIITKVNSNVRNRQNFSNTTNISTVEKSRVSNELINNPMKTKPENTRNEELFREKIPNFFPNTEIRKPENIQFKEVTTNADFKNNLLSGNEKNYLFPKGQQLKPNIDTSSKGDNNRNEEIKVITMENIMKFVKEVADAISKNTKRGVNGKVKYLNDLKETLLYSIKERIDATWPNDEDGGRSGSAGGGSAGAGSAGVGSPGGGGSARRRRRARSPRGHVEFPSSESSLMTISFLTFAVFLIKLVLQVIQTYKNKTMMMAPLVVATAAAGRALHSLRHLH